MPLSASRLNGQMLSTALTAIQNQFPINANLQPQEKIDLAAAQQKLAHSIADNLGTDVVNEITGNAVVNVTSVSIPSTAAPGSPSTGSTATSTVS